MSRGGMRSLVATAAALTASSTNRVVLLHMTDGRAAARRHWQHVRRQAKHFEIDRMYELPLPPVRIDGVPPATVEDPNALHTLSRWQTLVLGWTAAAQLQADQLIWPIQVNGDFESASRTTEQAMLLQQIMRLDLPDSATIQTPLLELNDQQLIELGGQLDVPWKLAWSCSLTGEQPCRVCDSCRRRRAAFETAGMIDPIEKPAGVT